MAKRRRLNRERVIAQAAAMADEAGDATVVSLTALAQALDVRTPSLYNHVASLEDLRAGLALHGAQILLAKLQQASQGLVGREAVMATAVAYRHFAQNHPGLYPLTIRAPEPDESELVASSQQILQMLLLIMASLGLAGDDALHAIRGLRAILHGFTSLERAGGYKMDLDRDESFRHLLGTYLQGLPTPAAG